MELQILGERWEKKRLGEKNNGFTRLLNLLKPMLFLMVPREGLEPSRA